MGRRVGGADSRTCRASDDLQMAAMQGVRRSADGRQCEASDDPQMAGCGRAAVYLESLVWDARPEPPPSESTMRRPPARSAGIVLTAAALLGGCAHATGPAAWPSVATDTVAGNLADANEGLPSADAIVSTDGAQPPVCNNACCEGPSAPNLTGNCTLLPTGQCVVACDANCANATLRCPLSGECTAVDGECVVRGDADCKGSKNCAQFKRCVEGVLGGGCVTAEVANSFCKTQDACKQGGACKGTDGNCIDPSDPTNCAKTFACHAQGRCSWDGERCTALTVADCKGMWCGEHCAVKGGVCKLADTDEACQSQPACAARGRCHARDGRCVPLSEEDCQQAVQCTKYARYSYRETKQGDKTLRVCCDKDGNACQ